MWISLSSAQAIDELLQRFGGFHDGCLREVAIATESYVKENGAMVCPGHLDTTALLYFQRQNLAVPAIEMRCSGITRFQLRPTAEGCDSIISFGIVSLEQDLCRVAIYCIAGPISGPPNGMWLSPGPREEPDLEVISRSVEWRPLEGHLGMRFGIRSRYRRRGRRNGPQRERALG